MTASQTKEQVGHPVRTLMRVDVHRATCDRLRCLAGKCLIFCMLATVHVLAIIKARHALNAQPQWARVEITRCG